MKADKVNKLHLGLYRIHWKKIHGGGTSIAAVGQTYSGRRWMAPCNWVIKDENVHAAAGTSDQDDWDKVLKVELIEAAYKENKQ